MVAKAADIFCENGIHIAVPQDGDLDDLERERYDALRAALTAALAEMWRPIETAPRDRAILLAAYIVPSDEAQRNGSKPFWHIETGRAFGTKLDRWTNVLGEKPSHWMPLPPLPRCCR